MSKNDYGEVLSPEGVEERLVFREEFTVTLTGGGKYRAYALHGDQAPHSLGVANTEEEAISLAYLSMMASASFHISPERTLLALTQAIRKKK